ncbi:hypothetical protein TNCV_3831901 [Trichonephila clavipes]|nr:hypothetical protein TNCV_3831901 [Trichonephila clavipes]
MICDPMIFFPYSKPRRMHLLCTEQDDSRGFFLVEQQRLIECLGTRENECRPVGQRCTLNLSSAETSSRWCGVVVRRGGSSGVVHVTLLGFKITWSVAKSPRVAKQ